MNRCKACGGEVRLSAMRISVNRKRGVSHAIVHRGMGDCHATDGYTCAALKPYPRDESEREWNKLIARWNAENPETEP